MKKLLVLIMVAISTLSFAQETRVIKQPNNFTPHVRINGYTLYAFDDKVDSYYSSTEYFNGKIKGGFLWGGGIEYLMIPHQSIEISYLRLDSDAPMTYYNNGVKNTVFDVGSNYIMLGSNRYFTANPKVEPYAGLQAGMTIFNIKNPDNNRSENATKLAWGAKVGANIWVTEKVGLKIQAGLLSAVQGVGGGFYFGTGGAGGGFNAYSSFYQFSIGGGLTFNLGE